MQGKAPRELEIHKSWNCGKGCLKRWSWVDESPLSQTLELDTVLNIKQTN